MSIVAPCFRASQRSPTLRTLRRTADCQSTATGPGTNPECAAESTRYLAWVTLLLRFWVRNRQGSTSRASDPRPIDEQTEHVGCYQQDGNLGQCLYYRRIAAPWSSQAFCDIFLIKRGTLDLEGLLRGRIERQPKLALVD